ncbi:PIN domain-containing protein [bacterium]|nr:PIN domain-containing protein [bacterium]
MVLADTSVWIDHFRRGNAGLADLLNRGEVCTHPFVIGELACGTLKNRIEILSLLGQLPAAAAAVHEEIMLVIEQRTLWGRGIGYVDAALLASALLAHAPLWTLDKKLLTAAAAVGVAVHR